MTVTAYTALVEVRPYLNSLVSVASIQVKEALIIADLTYDGFAKTDGIENYLFYLIMTDFSKPSNSNKKDYIPTQYITEFIKSLGFEGIRFNSSLYGRGRNVTIFNYNKCEAVDSKLYQINDICYEAKAIAPEQEEDLVHYKLLPYKEKDREELLNYLFRALQKNND
ncbi:RES family NAD+ phosphorylase [Paenibacillus sp. JMULE4]|uniref:RES family NAD+ phosphorylase n=1 Tax=Paenibacillus sp. JMULE4 TaxID=2518342 RepID=UPI001C2DD9B8|nr:RES family NAD+ phosphorylase [Paenibacillus sp. JMULE4]